MDTGDSTALCATRGEHTASELNPKTHDVLLRTHHLRQQSWTEAHKRNTTTIYTALQLAPPCLRTGLKTVPC